MSNAFANERLQELASDLDTAVSNAEQMSTLCSDIRRNIESCRDFLQHALVQRHNGDERAALEDDQFDALFARAGNVLRKKDLPPLQKRRSRPAKKVAENGGTLPYRR